MIYKCMLTNLMGAADVQEEERKKERRGEEEMDRRAGKSPKP